MRTADLSVQELNEQRDDNNSSLLMRLREDTYAAQLLQAMCCYVNPLGLRAVVFVVQGLS